MHLRYVYTYINTHKNFYVYFPYISDICPIVSFSLVAVVICIKSQGIMSSNNMKAFGKLGAASVDLCK